MSFINLHQRSDFSFADSLLTCDELVARQHALGRSRVVLTDRGNLLGAMALTIACQRCDVLPGYGLEVEMISGGGLLLFAKSSEGWRNLLHLSTSCCAEWPSVRPLTWEILGERCAGLMAIALPREDDCSEALAQLCQFFAPSDLAVELPADTVQHEPQAVAALLEVAARYDLSPVATAPAQYALAGDADAYRLAAMAKVGEGGRASSHILSDDEAAAIFAAVPEAVTATAAFAEKLELSIRQPRKMAADGLGAADTLLPVCLAGLQERGIDDPSYAHRLEHECQVISGLGYHSYFLFVKAYVDCIRGHGFPICDRGSAAGSLVNYALGITTTDPMLYGLQFERFLNADRGKAYWPDIDLDIPSEARPVVVKHLQDKWGASRIAEIVAPYHRSTEQAVTQVAELAGLSKQDAVALRHQVQAADADSENVHAQAVRLLDGKVFKLGRHSSGLALAPEALLEHTALINSQGSAHPITQFDGVACEQAGLVKFDILSSRTLSICQDTLRLIKKRHAAEIDLDAIPETYADTFELFAAGDTVGVFQFGSAALRPHLQSIKPSNMHQLATILALFRPGCRNMLEQYQRQREKGERPTPIAPPIDEILAPSDGVLAFQEQVASILAWAGYTLAEADIARRHLMRIDDQAEDVIEHFEKGAIANGLAADAVTVCVDILRRLSGYCFNQAHAIAYARLAYRTAYLKANYRLEFTVAAINQQAREQRAHGLIDDSLTAGLVVKPPNINTSHEACEIQSGEIHLGLANTKYCGADLVAEILAEREAGGEFVNLFELCQRIDGRVLGRRQLLGLIASGALNSLPGSIAQKFASVEQALRRSPDGQLVDAVSSFDLMREIVSRHYCATKDLSFDIYCPKTYAHHLRFTFWLPRDRALFDLDTQEFLHQGQLFLGYFDQEHSNEYTIGLNSRLDQYADKHLLMLDLDSLDEEAVARLEIIGGYLLKSGSGFHFIANEIVRSQQAWRRRLQELHACPALNAHVDDNFVKLSLDRGYATLRILESPLKPFRPVMVRVLGEF